jgi:hypothetical protein
VVFEEVRSGSSRNQAPTDAAVLLWEAAPSCNTEAVSFLPVKPGYPGEIFSSGNLALLPDVRTVRILEVHTKGISVYCSAEEAEECRAIDPNPHPDVYIPLSPLLRYASNP